MAAQQSEDEGYANDDLDGWDPIEDTADDDRGRFIDLIRHFLWMEPSAAQKQEEAAERGPKKALMIQLLPRSLYAVAMQPLGRLVVRRHRAQRLASRQRRLRS